MVRPEEVSGLASGADQQGATALLATMEDLKPADLADVLADLPLARQVEVAAELDDARLADAVLCSGGFMAVCEPDGSLRNRRSGKL